MTAIYSVTRDPEEVKRGEIEHESILRAIQMGRSANLSDKKIALLLRKNFKMILPYAENYIAEYDREVAKNILPWKEEKVEEEEEEEVDETDGE